MMLLRHVRLLAADGERYDLRLWASDRFDSRGQTVLCYRLSWRGLCLFDGSDFAGSPLHADDSDATVAALLTFLTLRPGDTDAEYFAEYSPGQLAWASAHGEALAATAWERFGDRD